MFTLKLFICAVLSVSINCLPFENPALYREYFDERSDVEDFYSRGQSLSRVRRQLAGSISTNPDGSPNVNARLPLFGNEHNQLSAIGALSGNKDGGLGSVGGGLAFQNEHGHGLTGMAKHIPGFGNQLTGAGKLNLFHNDNHKVDANAFITRNIPSIPNVPSFNTYGGNLDYMYKNKVGASLGMAQTDFLQRKDYSAMGNLNLFRDRGSSLDLNAGFSKSVSPFNPRSSWQPSGGLTFTKFW